MIITSPSFQEREVTAQERETRKETRHAQMLATLQGSPVANPESLKDKAPGKCLIYRQAGRWAEECSNHAKSPETACYKCHHRDIGWHSALGTQEP